MKIIKLLCINSIFLSNISFPMEGEREHIQRILITLVKKNQEMRHHLNPENPNQDVIRNMQAIDTENTWLLKKIVARYGWITISEFGPEADHHAWLLAQHATHDPKFQKLVLQKLEICMYINETDPKHYAYLYDRIAVCEGKPQRFGTQINFKDGIMQPQEIEDPDNLDKRRLFMGLCAINEHIPSTTQE